MRKGLVPNPYLTFSYGIKLAQMLRIPKTIIENSKKIVAEILQDRKNRERTREQE